jgi:hypothetical protein
VSCVLLPSSSCLAHLSIDKSPSRAYPSMDCRPRFIDKRLQEGSDADGDIVTCPERTGFFHPWMTKDVNGVVSGQISAGFGSRGFRFGDDFSPMVFGFGALKPIEFGFGFGFSPVDI